MCITMHGSENVMWFRVCVFKNTDGIDDLHVWLPERECVLPKIHVKENLPPWLSWEYRHLCGTLNDTCCTHPRLQADLRSWPRLANLSMLGKISACSTRKSERSFTHFVFVELQNWISEATILNTCSGVYWADHRWRVWYLVSFFWRRCTLAIIVVWFLFIWRRSVSWCYLMLVMYLTCL